MRDYVQNDEKGIRLVRFDKRGHEIRLIADVNNKITYSYTTKENLKKIVCNKGRKSPHYLETILEMENNDCVSYERQITMRDFGYDYSERFDESTYENDFKIINREEIIDLEENYKHYLIVYDIKYGDIYSIVLKLLDKGFNLVDEKSLMEYIKPEFAEITEFTRSDNDSSEENSKPSRKPLVALKKRKGIKPKLREEEKRPGK